jgi:cytochrome c biogenesis protein CcmG/thiol:disulfide interchange protein DsbE
MKKDSTLAVFFISVVFALLFIPPRSNFFVRPPALKISLWLNTEKKSLSLEELEGKVVLLWFWATWCIPCQSKIELLNGLYKKYREKGFEIIGISAESPQTLASFLKSTPMDYPIGVDESKETHKRYGIRVYPVVYLLDSSGKVMANYFSEELIQKALASRQ